MFEYQCEADNARNRGRCKRNRTMLVWCFEYQGERFDRATWVSTCTHHLAHARRIVSMLSA